MGDKQRIVFSQEWNIYIYIYRIEIKRLKEEKKEKFEVYKFSKRDVETEKYI